MLFPTVSFAVFFAVVLPVSWLLMPHRVRWKLFSVAASLFFYGCAGWGFVPLLVGSIVVNHAFALAIDRSRDPRRRSAWARLAVVANLVVLGWLKYIGFLSSSASSLLTEIGWHVRLPLPTVLLPAGISFFTFQALSYVIDVNRRKVRPVPLLDFAVYLSFFPHLLSGPIVRASEFLPQIRRRIDPRRVDMGQGLWLIAQGLAKKVVIAGYLSTKAVDPLFGFPHQHAGLEALFGVYAYAVEIYADFSGYTDMAIGLALLLGIRFPQNFNAPYTAVSLRDFWRRWHMTLSRWLRDYLYIPLGGNRRGRVRTYVNLLLTMLLGGLWHGAAWTFVAWGGLHGLGLAAERFEVGRRIRRLFTTEPATGGLAAGVTASGVTAPGGPAAMEQAATTSVAATPAPIPADPVSPGPVSPGPVSPGPVGVTQLLTGAVSTRRRMPPAARAMLRWVLTFHVVCLGWVFFRATSFGNAVEVLRRIFAGGPHVHLDDVVVLTVVASIASQFVPTRWSGSLQARFSRLGVFAQAGLLAAGLMVIDAFGPAGIAPFIYFRF